MGRTMRERGEEGKGQEEKGKEFGKNSRRLKRGGDRSPPPDQCPPQEGGPQHRWR